MPRSASPLLAAVPQPHARRSYGEDAEGEDLVGGTDDEGSDDDDQPTTDDAEAIREAAQKAAAALDSVNSMPMGQAFATLRQAKRAGNTLRPEPVFQNELDEAQRPSGQAPVGAPAADDLSSLLPGGCVCMHVHADSCMWGRRPSACGLADIHSCVCARMRLRDAHAHRCGSDVGYSLHPMCCSLFVMSVPLLQHESGSK
eukprot:256117-Chlamydomonas_euryale.AAC.4